LHLVGGYMFKVFTVEREYGSGGAEIAGKLAERLGWKLWDQLLTDEIARQLDCPSRTVEEHEERRNSLYYRLFKAFPPLKNAPSGTSANAWQL
jgi:hypothetical protein